MGGIRDDFWEKMVAKDYKTQGEKKLFQQLHSLLFTQMS